jgi:hypothetical protein
MFGSDGVALAVTIVLSERPKSQATCQNIRWIDQDIPCQYPVIPR